MKKLLIAVAVVLISFSAAYAQKTSEDIYESMNVDSVFTNITKLLDQKLKENPKIENKNHERMKIHMAFAKKYAEDFKFSIRNDQNGVKSFDKLLEDMTIHYKKHVLAIEILPTSYALELSDLTTDLHFLLSYAQRIYDHVNKEGKMVYSKMEDPKKIFEQNKNPKKAPNFTREELQDFIVATFLLDENYKEKVAVK